MMNRYNIELITEMHKNIGNYIDFLSERKGPMESQADLRLVIDAAQRFTHVCMTIDDELTVERQKRLKEKIERKDFYLNGDAGALREMAFNLLERACDSEVVPDKATITHQISRMRDAHPNTFDIGQ
jgi:hypothetical protein